MNNLDQYVEYLNSKTISRYISIPSISNEYETFVKYYSKKGLSIDELFLKVIRDNNLIMFRKMITDVRVNPAFMNNESVILCVLHDKYRILSILLQHPQVVPYDQNNLALRLAINMKNKPILDLLLKCQSVIDHIYQDPDLLSYVYIYQTNGNVIL